MYWNETGYGAKYLLRIYLLKIFKSIRQTVLKNVHRTKLLDNSHEVLSLILTC